MTERRPADLDALRIAQQDAATAPEQTLAPPPSRWRTRVLVPLVLVVLTAGLLVAGFWEKIAPATEVRVVPCVVKTVAQQPAAVAFQASGWIEPAPFPIYVSALTEGVVAEMLVLEGEVVEANQVVARLIPDDARLGFAAANAELALREAEVTAQQVEARTARERLDTLIERGATAETTRARTRELTAAVDRARAAREQAAALLKAREEEIEKKRELVASGAVSALEVAILEQQLLADRAALEAATAATEVAAGKLEAAQAQEKAATRNLDLLIDERRAVDAANAGLAAAQARVQLATARRDEAALRLERVEVRAPTAGTVLERVVSPGSVVGSRGGQSSRVAHLYDPARLQVRTDVPLADASLVAPDQRAEITVETLPDAVFHGRVSRLVHLADIQKNTVEVKVDIEDPRSELKPEMLARVRFLGRQDAGDDAKGPARERIFAPLDLLEIDASGRATALVVVDRVEDRGRAERRELTLEPGRQNGWVEVSSGLLPGDRLIAEPRDGIAAGDRVLVTGEARRSESAGKGGR